MKKVILIVGFLMVSAITAFAATRNNFMVPVNQTGAADSFALPCTPKAIVAAANTAVTPLLALDEAGMVYWMTITPATAGDYAVLRDSGTANTSSTPVATLKGPSITDSREFRFEPPLFVSNGLSVNVSSQTTSVVVCVREADGDL